jgi:hypothetical protein
VSAAIVLPKSHRRTVSVQRALLGAVSVLFIGTQFSNLYTAVDTPAMGRVVVCLVFVYLVFVCKYVLGHSRVSEPSNVGNPLETGAGAVS